jgi:hypothetical protein
LPGLMIPDHATKVRIFASQLTRTPINDPVVRYLCLPFPLSLGFLLDPGSQGPPFLPLANILAQGSKFILCKRARKRGLLRKGSKHG